MITYGIASVVYDSYQIINYDKASKHTYEDPRPAIVRGVREEKKHITFSIAFTTFVFLQFLSLVCNSLSLLQGGLAMYLALKGISALDYV